MAPVDTDWLGVTLNIVTDRILTNACRDPLSPSYGSFDRNWWHYRIVDFPSAILQQAAETLSCSVGSMPAAWKPGVDDLVQGSARFWNRRATRRGAFEEYYPYEGSFPALAFSTLAMGNLVIRGAVQMSDVAAGLKVASAQLVRRVETDAMNQELAAIAALARLHQIDDSMVPLHVVRSRYEEAIGSQSPEGWFNEYYGADTGYLSVGLDCLWEVHDAVPEVDSPEARVAAFSFLSSLVLHEVPSLATVNSRNTDYIVPYGIARMTQVPETSSDAWAVLCRLGQTSILSPTRFPRIDDRYSSHYIGRSIAKTWEWLTTSLLVTPVECATRPTRATLNLSSAGIFALKTDDGGTTAWVAGRKGGNFTSRLGANSVVSDHGWRVVDHGRTYVSDWCAPSWVFESTGSSSVSVEGPLISARALEATPLRHLGLRVAAFLMRQRLIPLLKRALILKSHEKGPTFRRSIDVTSGSICVADEFLGISPDATIESASSASMRHVSSADSFSSRDFALSAGSTITRTTTRKGNDCFITTTYQIPSWSVPS